MEAPPKPAQTDLPPSDSPPVEAPRKWHPHVRRGLRWVRNAAGIFLAWSLFWVLVFRFAGPPFTYLTLRDRLSGQSVDRRPVPIETISRHLILAVVTAEDQRFCLHHGFDWEAIFAAQSFNARSNRLRGASTISMQTAKNAFLWPGRTWIRKGFEAYYTVLIEFVWPKWRILEVYLNVAEWGDGLYGAEAAARHYFSKPAAQLTRSEAALMAAALPSPRTSNPARPSAYLSSRRSRIISQMHDVGEAFGECLEW